MARTLKTKPAVQQALAIDPKPEAKAGRHDAKHVAERSRIADNANTEVKAGRWRVQRIAGKSAPLIEVGAGSPMWRGTKKGHAEVGWLPQVWDGVSVKGCIAKITPPAGTSDVEVNSMEHSFYEGGALTVRVMPAAAHDKLQTPAEPASKGIDAVNRSLRQVAIDRAQRVTNARDAAALVALVGVAMDHAEQTT